MSNLLEDLPSLMILIGAALLLIEALAFGFSLVILAALGFATITTGLLIKFGFVRESVDAALISTIIVTVGSVLLAWKPLK
ncbi:MAG: activity regulator of membrane protease YbbK, partial [Porticoccaceae bacterium]|nr:activity regulator of membrane protease YbbK [Porticoccaceae bacterium]